MSTRAMDATFTLSLVATGSFLRSLDAGWAKVEVARAYGWNKFLF